MRTPHRSSRIRPAHRTALAAALAMALGSGTVLAATDIPVSNATDLATAIRTMNGNADCTDDTITLGAFVFSISTPLPAVTCPHLTIQGTGSYPYGSKISSAYSYGDICAIESSAPISVLDMEINGFSYGGSSAALCGAFDTADATHPRYGVHGVRMDSNDNGVIVNAPGATIGSSGDGNLIYGNSYTYGGSGILVNAGGSAEIAGNFIGTSDGSTVAGNYIGVDLGGNASSVHDNAIAGNTQYGIQVADSGGSIISTNRIGTTPDGETSIANGEDIIVAVGTSVTIDRNVIGSSSYGITMYGGGTISNNNIGLDNGGTVGFGGYTGVRGNGVGSDLVISGNAFGDLQYGIDLASATGSVVTGNSIGITAQGGPLATTGIISDGISLHCSSGVQVSSNFIGGFYTSAVGIYGSDTTSVTGNHLGVARDGVTPLSNYGYGVLIDGASCTPPAAAMTAAKSGLAKASLTGIPSNNNIAGNFIEFNGGSGILIRGGAGTGNSITNNTIAHNGQGGFNYGSGVAIRDPSSVGNAIVGNSIFANAPKNIDLDSTDPTLPLANDAGDADTGANDGLNTPVISSVTYDGTNTVITYTLDTPTTSGQGLLVEFFTNDDASLPAGKVSHGFGTGGLKSGPGPFTETFAGLLDNVSLTSTLATSPTTPIETSEFSPVVSITPLPVVNVTPTSAAFGNVEVGDNGAPSQTVTLASAGPAPWVVSNLTTASCVSAAPAPLTCGANFVCSTTCAYDTSYARGDGCSITAQFAPTTLGASNVTISICDNTTTPPKTIQLSGSGVLPPPVTVTPNGFNFGSVVTGTTSAAQAFTIANPAKTAVTLAAPVATSPFAVASTTCGSTLAAGASCVADVTFTPSATGVSSGRLDATFTSNATGTPFTATASAALAGIGVAAVQVTVPSSVNVGTYVIGLAPATATATVTNTGKSAAAISGITVSAPFTVTHDCPASLASNATCTITVSLADTTVGPVTGSISVNTAAGVQRIGVSGVVNPPALSMVPAQVDFGTIGVNRESAPQDIVATNTTGFDVPIGTPVVTPPFRLVSSTCGTFLGANGRCTLTTTFAPTRGGAATGSLSLNFGVNAALAATSAAKSARGAKAAQRGAAKSTTAGVATATLSGNAIDAAILDVTSLVEFGTYIPGAPPIVRTVTVTSSGTAVVTFQNITVSGPFGLTHDCPIELAPGASCTLTLSFSSSTLGSAAGVVSILSNAIGGLRTISLGALTQARPVPIVSVSPVSISFGNRLIGTQSPTSRVTVTNSGGADAALGPMTPSRDYIVTTSTCTATLAAQASCTVDVAMSPIGFGPRPGSLSFTSNADGSPHSVILGGIGCRPFSVTGNRGGSESSCAP